MKKKIIYTVILLLAIMIQTSIVPVVTGFGSSGDAVAMMVLAWSVIDGFRAFFAWAVAAGILYDLASYSPIGMHVLVFLPILYFVSFFSRRFTLESRGVGIFLFFVFVIISTVLLRGANHLEMIWPEFSWQNYLDSFGNFREFMFSILYNVIFFFLWFAIIKKVKTFFKLED